MKIIIYFLFYFYKKAGSIIKGQELLFIGDSLVHNLNAKDVLSLKQLFENCNSIFMVIKVLISYN